MSTDDWTLEITLRRRWSDGTEFIIRPATRDPGNPPRRTLSGFQLTLVHPAGLRAHSHHPTIATAKAHADEMLASLPEAARRPDPDRGNPCPQQSANALRWLIAVVAESLGAASCGGQDTSRLEVVDG